MEENKVVVVNLLYRHFKGDYYHVEKVATNESNGENVVVYSSISTGQTFVRPYEEFFTDVSDREDNITHQVHRFEPANELKGVLKLTPTIDLIKELELRGDNPYEGFKTLEEDENVWSVQFLLGRIVMHKDKNTDESYEDFVPLTPILFSDLKAAKSYRDRNFSNRNCVIARRVIKRIED